MNFVLMKKISTHTICIYFIERLSEYQFCVFKTLDVDLAPTYVQGAAFSMGWNRYFLQRRV